VKKSKGPAPGTYDIDNCYRKTQWKTNVFSWSKGKYKNYVDDVVKAKTFIPGVGKYKELDKGYGQLSRPPTSLQRRR
jgi:hypothetical protein